MTYSTARHGGSHSGRGVNSREWTGSGHSLTRNTPLGHRLQERRLLPVRSLAGRNQSPCGCGRLPSKKDGRYNARLTTAKIWICAAASELQNRAIIPPCSAAPVARVR